MLGTADNVVKLAQRTGEQFAQLLKVRLDQIRVIGERAAEQEARRVDDNLNLFGVNLVEDLLVDILRHGSRNAACEHQRVACLELLQTHHELAQLLLLNDRSLAVDLGLQTALQLNIDAGKSGGETDEVGLTAQLLHAALDVVTGEAGDEAEGDVRDTHAAEDDGDIDALAADKDALRIDAVELANLEVVDLNAIIQRRIEGNSINHSFFTSMIVVSLA